MIEEVRSDYVRTARSKGSTKFRIMYVHVLKNAIISVVPLIGMIVSLMTVAFRSGTKRGR